MRWRTRSNCPAGRAAKSMPARLNSPRKPARKATMAKTDGVLPPDKLPKPPAPARVAAFRTGISAEARAAAYLMAKGYRILAKRFRTPYGEIDIVARRRNLLAFVEVKARASLDEGAHAWLMTHPEHADFDMRFDVMLIAPKRLPRHLLAAFDAST